MYHCILFLPTKDYIKNRRLKIKDIVLDFFLRHPDTWFTHEEFHYALLGLSCPAVFDLKHTPYSQRSEKVESFRQHVQNNPNKDLLIRWEELRPSDKEESLVWQDLELGKLRVENFRYLQSNARICFAFLC